MEETEYLRAPNLLVTSTRIEINGQTFATRNVGSVKVLKQGKSWLGIVIGAFVILTGLIGLPNSWPALLIGAAIAAWGWFKGRSQLVLMSGGGEVVAYSSPNAQAVDQLRSAIASAIAAR